MLLVPVLTKENTLFKGRDILKQDVLFTNPKFYFLVTMLSQHPTKECMIAPQNDYNKTANFLATGSTENIHRNVLLNNPACQIQINLLSKEKPFVFKSGTISLPLYIYILALKY